MATEFKLPELGENIETGDVVRVAVSPGETVHEGQTVVELETDKAVIEVPSGVNGKVEQVAVKQSQKVKAGDVLFTYTSAEAPKGEAAQSAKKEKTPERAAEKPAGKAPEKPTEEAAEQPAEKPAAKTTGKTAEKKSPPSTEAPPTAPATPATQGPSAPPPSPPRREKTKETTAKPPASGQAELRLPELGENIESGDVVRVSVHPGEQVSDGQTVLELETDKAVVEVPSTLTGTVNEVKVQTGQKLKVGDLILTLTATEPKAEAAVPASAPTAARPSTPTAGAPGTPEAEAGAGEQAAEAAPSEPTAGELRTPQPESEDHSDEGYMAMARDSFYSARTAEGKEEEAAFPPDVPPQIDLHVYLGGVVRHAGHEHRTVPAAPIVRKLAREIGVDIYLVKGSGPGGRISEDDVKTFARAVFAQMAESRLQGAARAEIAKLPDFSRWGKVEKVSLRAVRRKTAEHVSLAWNVVPHVTQFDKADVSELEELRKRFAPKAEKAGGKMTMTAIALKVVASALKAFPQFNASIDMASEEIIYKRYIHIGVAVDTERGLLVPVIRDVDKKNIIDLAVELSAISKKAHDKRLMPQDMEGGTFTITNLGGVGGTSFTPIVNYPEVAILGISRTHTEPLWTNDGFEPRSMLPLSLSYDHRIIDGADAARFLRWIVDALEQPFLLSVQG